MIKTKKNYRDSIFRMLYLDKKELLSLYNAVNGTDYTDEESLEVNTLKNAIYMNIKNDVSFLFDFQVNLYEHQSTVNPNIPLRDLMYVSRLLHNIVKERDLYGKTLVKIPTPRFVVFYNGKEEQPEKRVYRLSDAFCKKLEKPELELIVTVLNINAGNNDKLLENCKTLRKYMQYIERVRSYAVNMPIEQAVEKAITECIKEDILADFLKKNRAEAMEVSIFEYNEELHLANTRREGYEDGLEKGMIQMKAQDILELLEELGEVSAEIQKMIVEQNDMEKLSKWFKVAAKSSNAVDFIKRINE